MAGLTVDNSETSLLTLKGTWSTGSGTPGFIGSNYLHDSNGGKGSKSVTFRPTVTDAGNYEVFLYWSSQSNRASNVPVDVIHADGTNTIVINQRQGGGQWQSLGAFRFTSGQQGAVRIRNDGTNGLVIADAIQLVSSVDTSAPTALLSNPAEASSIAASQLNALGYLDVSFPDVGSGVNPTTLTDNAAEFTLSGSAASGVVVHGVPTHVAGEIYRYSFTGSFGLGQVTANFVSSSWADVAGNVNAASTGSFTTTTVQPKLTIDNSDTGDLNVVGAWSVGNGVVGYVGSNFAHDANGGKGAKSFTYLPTIADAGTYEVFLRWTSKSNRASNVPVDVIHADGTNTVMVNQRLSGGQWNSLGIFRFESGKQPAVRIRNAGTNGLVVADAIQLVSSVDLTAPSPASLVNPGDTGSVAAVLLNAQGYLDVNFTDIGSGIDAASITDVGSEFTLSGTAASGVTVHGAALHVSGSTYRYSFTGTFGLGTVTVSFQNGTWSDQSGNSNVAHTGTFTTIALQPKLQIDNSDLGDLTLAGSWMKGNGVAGYVGVDFLHDNNTGKGTKSVTYRPTIADAGNYEVFVRWTSRSNRASNVPIDVLHADGTSTTVVNQRQGGGQWVSLGTFRFEVGKQSVLRVRNTGTNGIVIADAMKLERALPKATLANPMANGSISEVALNALGHLDVTFSDPSGAGLNASSITDVGAEFTLGGTAASGVTVSGAPTLVSGTTYRYSFSGSFGLGSVTVAYVQNSWHDLGGVGNAAFEQTFTVASPYNIQFVFPDSSLTNSQKQIFQQAGARWSELIVADIPDVQVSGYGLVDDLVIEATGPSIDGPGKVLGSAGPTALRTGSFLPAYGRMQFDSADLASLESSGQLLSVILHEMGHVIGIGTIWKSLGLLSGAGTTNPRFLGTQATAEYNAAFGRSENSIPVEATGGAGTRDAHWRETVFANELMTGYLNAGTNPLSRITIASLADLGYTVNLAAADAYTPPGSVTQSSLTAASSTTNPALQAAASRSLFWLSAALEEHTIDDGHRRDANTANPMELPSVVASEKPPRSDVDLRAIWGSIFASRRMMREITESRIAELSEYVDELAEESAKRAIAMTA